ncbi:MAG: class I SAM-dependent methyltransferase, partial [candidate division NC10 bacterium]|nr:class I SAM-dependent methyltransferase [candidate division NC10 bacterium]
MIELRRTYERYWAARRADAGGAAEGSGSPNEIFESVGSVLGEGKRLLDVGCGVGTLLDLVGAKFQAVHGCDLSETALREARQRGVLSVCADLNRGLLPYQDRSFECVTCLEVIEHVFDPLSLLRELHRVLKDDGQLVLTTPNIRYFRNVLTLVWHGRFPHTTMDTFVWGGGHLHYFTRTDLKL